MKISVIILAAGGSKRMGELNKLLLLIDGKPMIHSVCKMVLGARVNQIVLVTGYQSNKIEKSIPEGINTIVHNRKWESGMMSSICAGMSRLDKDVEGNMKETQRKHQGETKGHGGNTKSLRTRYEGMMKGT